MAKRLQLRRGTTSQHSTFTGANGEVTVDSTKKTVVVHDGSTAGGFPLATETLANNKVARVTSTDNAIVRFDGTTGQVQNSGVIIDDSGNLGIGTSSPISQLDVNSTTNTFAKIRTGTGYNSSLMLLPNGSGSGVSLSAFADNSAVLYNQLTGPLSFGTSNSERMRIDTAGNVLITSPGALGYGTGAGGTVTQLTSKSTSVTLNKPTGRITTSSSALASGAYALFVVNNSLVANDEICVTPSASVDLGKYRIEHTTGIGYFQIKITNISATSYSDALDIYFSIIKGAIA